MFEALKRKIFVYRLELEDLKSAVSAAKVPRLSFFIFFVIVFFGYSTHVVEMSRYKKTTVIQKTKSGKKISVLMCQDPENPVDSEGKIKRAPCSEMDFGEPFQGIWWAIVTFTTVGYGDISPTTLFGKIVAIILMFFSLVLMVVLSGTIASLLVDRKIKEGQGLRKIMDTGHIVICGWNVNAIPVLEGLIHLRQGKYIHIVLVNEMDPDAVNDIKFKYNSKYVKIDFIKGDFTLDATLDKANIKGAISVIILADTSGENTWEKSDERTVFAVLAIRDLNPDLTISCELLHPEKEQHIRRAEVDNVIINGEFNGFLLANAALEPRVPQAIKELLRFNLGNEIMKVPLPGSLAGEKFEKVVNHFMHREKAMVIGILTESKKMSIDDFLSGSKSAIDDFIAKKFAEAEEDYFADTVQKGELKLNPEPDYILNSTDQLFIISRN